MNSDVQQAINAEKTFNNRNNLLVTFHDQEINENSFKKLHKNVKNVHILEPEFIPKKRYIVEIKDLSEIDVVKDAILQSRYQNGYLTINFMDHFTDSYKHIDPYKLHVKNLPISVTDKEIKLLYPFCTQYSYVKPDSRHSKSILANFANVKDAIAAYKITNKIIYRSNNLKVQFYRDKSKATEDSNEEHTDSEDDISKWEKIENECLKNKKVSDTLLIKNFPIDTTRAEVLKLYPECCDIKFLFDSSSKAKSALIQFRKTEDAIKMYTVSNNIFKSNILHIEFHYKDSDNKKTSKIKSEKETNKNQYSGVNDREEYGNEEGSQNNSNLKHFESKLNEEEINNKNVDPNVLHVENLPLATTTEDLLQLFPEHQQYQIIPEKSTNSSLAYVCFNSSLDALQAYKATKNKLYKRRVLSVKFKSKKLKINPFALLKRKTNDLEDNNKKRVKLKPNINESLDNDDVILVGEISNNQSKLISEDDVECKSEDEDYADDIYTGIDLETDELDNEDNISVDTDFQGVELDDDTVLPLDEDDF